MSETKEYSLFRELTKEECVAVNGGNNSILDLLQILLPLIPTSTNSPTPSPLTPTPYSPFITPRYTGGFNSSFEPVSGLIFSILS